MIEQEIRARIIKAVKERDDIGRNVLRCLIGEVERMGSVEKGDNVWIEMIKKMIKGIDSSIEVAGEERAELVKQMKLEREILGEFLPKKMSKEEIREFIIENKIIVSGVIGEGRSIGNVMKVLRAGGKEFDNGDVKAIVIEMLGYDGMVH